MPTLKVIVDKLYRRKSPVTNFADKSNIVDVVNKNTIFESDGEITNLLGKWYKDKDGYYYWEGGLANITAKINYTKFVTALDFDWLKTNGTGTTIGLIDTGITPDKNYYNEFEEKIISNANNVLHHGNFIGGILCGKQNIIGLAKNAKLYSIKYKSNGDDLSVQLDNFIIALTDILNRNDAMIINISQGFNAQILTDKFKKQEQQITDLIKQISVQKNKIIVCAGDDNDAINDALFPGSMDECISVGCIDEFSTDVIIKVKLDILMPMVTYTSYDNLFNQIRDSGSSFSTAVISAFAASYLSEKNSIVKNNFLNELKTFSTDRSLFKYGELQSFQYQTI